MIVASKQPSGKMWGGRFSETTAASVEAFSASIHYDARLYRHDIMGSKAHARMLARQGLIDSAEVRLPMVEVGAELAARLDAEERLLGVRHRTPAIVPRAQIGGDEGLECVRGKPCLLRAIA